MRSHTAKGQRSDYEVVQTADSLNQQLTTVRTASDEKQHEHESVTSGKVNELNIDPNEVRDFTNEKLEKSQSHENVIALAERQCMDQTGAK